MFVGHYDLTQFVPGPEAFNSPSCINLERRLWETLRQNITWRGNEGFHEQRPHKPYLILEQGLLRLADQVIESVILSRHTDMDAIMPRISALQGTDGVLGFLACASTSENGIYTVRRMLSPNYLPEFNQLIKILNGIFMPFTSTVLI